MKVKKAGMTEPKNRKGFSSSLKRGWMKGVHAWNQTVILVFLFLIWWLLLTPMAFLWRLFKRGASPEKRKSFLKKSYPLLPDHFKRPF